MVVLIYISLMISGVDCLFMYLLAIWISFLEKCNISLLKIRMLKVRPEVYFLFCVSPWCPAQALTYKMCPGIAAWAGVCISDAPITRGHAYVPKTLHPPLPGL